MPNPFPAIQARNRHGRIHRQAGGAPRVRGTPQDIVFDRLGLKNRAVLNAGPYAQGKTLRQQACQIDLMIRTRQVIYVAELRFRRHTGLEVIDEVREKIARLKLPKSQSVRAVLIHTGELDPSIEASDYFDHVINADEWITGLKGEHKRTAKPRWPSPKRN